jgi:hypothetical protein
MATAVCPLRHGGTPRAQCADTRDAEGKKSLFTEDTHFVVYMDGKGTEPTQVLDGRESLTPVFDDLNRYQATMHFTDKARSRSTATVQPERATASPTTSTPRTTSEN